MADERVRSRHHHVAAESSLAVRKIREAAGSVHGFNASTAIVVSNVLGSMPFYWFTNILALISLPATLCLLAPGLKTVFPSWLIKVSLISLVSWLSSVYIQLTALPVLQVSSNAQGKAQEQNTKTILSDAEETREHTARIIDALDTQTEGGLRDVLDAIERLGPSPKKPPN